ncbi:MAG: AMP-binding protein [Chloroflexi bacterium]|nr:AMP-binding protein [Chloroflexota bacterium]
MTKQTYEAVYARWQADPELFWAQAAQDVHWIKSWDKVLDDSRAPLYQWFAGAEVNSCYNALDVHVENGRAQQLALIYDSPVSDTYQNFTYQELRDKVATLAGVLANMGVAKGDRVIIYMPMVPEATMAMLACARIGAIHSVVFGGFAANELATRINDARPKVVLSASCGIEPARLVAYKPLLDQAIELAEFKPEKCLILQRPQLEASMVPGRDLDWHQAAAQAEAMDCVPVAATDPLYILYTSGTTGVPKGVVRDNGGHLVALKWSMKNIYNVEPGEVYWAASDVGWVVGHSYIVYGPLFHGCTTVMFEGKPVGTPDPGAFWRVIADYGVNTLFTAPTAIRAIKRDDPRGLYKQNYDLSCLNALFLAGERCDPDTLQWAGDLLGVPVVDHWWQTESGWPMVSNPLGIEPLPVKPGSASKEVPGYDVRVINVDNEEAAPDEIGDIVVKLPLPPGALPTLWQNDIGFRRSYLETYEGYYLTADAGYKDEDGYIFIMSRTDDIINVAGHRLSTGGIEGVISAHPDVAECAVIGVNDELKGALPLGLIVLKAGVTRDHEQIVREVIQMVREEIGPVAAFKKATVVQRLPKTRSGKVLRGTMKRIADRQEWRMPATIDDPVIFEEITDSLAEVGYGPEAVE